MKRVPVKRKNPLRLQDISKLTIAYSDLDFETQLPKRFTEELKNLAISVKRFRDLKGENILRAFTRGRMKSSTPG